MGQPPQMRWLVGRGRAERLDRVHGSRVVLVGHDAPPGVKRFVRGRSGTFPIRAALVGGAVADGDFGPRSGDSLRRTAGTEHKVSKRARPARAGACSTRARRWGRVRPASPAGRLRASVHAAAPRCPRGATQMQGARPCRQMARIPASSARQREYAATRRALPIAPVFSPSGPPCRVDPRCAFPTRNPSMDVARGRSPWARRSSGRSAGTSTSGEPLVMVEIAAYNR